MGDKPLVAHQIEAMVALGIRRVVIVIGHLGHEVVATLGDGERFGVQLQYVEQQETLGIAHAVKIARDYMGEAPFVLYLGDNFLLGGVRRFVESFRENGANCQILLHPVKNPQAFGIAEFVDGRVTRIVEKPVSPPSNLAVIGVYMFDQHVFEAVERIEPSARGELEITDTIQYFIDNGLDVQAELLDRYWIDTGKMDDILEANRMVLQSLAPRNRGQVDERTRVYEPVILEKGASVVNSVLRGPLVIGEETEIIDSYVGPNTTIDHHCRLKGVRVEGSIILENTSIEDIHWPIDRSLIDAADRQQTDQKHRQIPRPPSEPAADECCGYIRHGSTSQKRNNDVPCRAACQCRP